MAHNGYSRHMYMIWWKLISFVTMDLNLENHLGELWYFIYLYRKCLRNFALQLDTCGVQWACSNAQQSTMLKVAPQRLEYFVVITNCVNIVSLVVDPIIGLMQSNGRKPYKRNWNLWMTTRLGACPSYQKGLR